MNIGNVVKVVNARGCDNIAAGSFFTVRGVDDTCITIYNPNTKSLRRYAKYRFEVQRQQYKLKHQDPVVIRAASRSPVLRGQANGLGRYAVEFVSFVNDAIPEQRALFVTAEGPSKGTVILRHANGKAVSGESYDVVTA